MTVRHRGASRLDPSHHPSVVVSSHPVPVVRFEWRDRSVSYVQSEIRQWEFTALGTEDRIRIRAGSDLVTLAGSHLLPLRNALDQQRVQLVREQAGPHGLLSAEPTVRSIQVEKPAAPFR